MQGTWRGAHTHRAVSQKCRGQGTICHCHCRGDLEVLVRAGWFRNLGVSVLVGVLVGHVGEWHPCRSQGCGAGFWPNEEKKKSSFVLVQTSLAL